MTGQSPPKPVTPLARFDDAPRRSRRVSSGIVFHRIDRLPPRPPRTEVIAGLAAGGEVVALAGAPGSGKSALAVLAARMVADGLPFLGRAVARGATVYVAAERASEVERRLLVAASPGTAIYVSAARPQLAEPSSVEELIAGIAAVSEIEPLPIRLIVIDTAARCFRGLDENSSRDIGSAAQGLAEVAEAFPTAMLLILHHLDKGGSGMRGSGALLGAVDLELTVRGAGETRTVTVTKANSVAEGQKLTFRLLSRRALDGLDVIAAEAIDAAIGSETGPRASSRLPPDARMAFDTLGNLSASTSVISIQAWREATMEGFGKRSQAAKRKAWSKSLRTLTECGRIAVSGESVSVSDA